MRDNTEDLIVEACYAVIRIKSAICILFEEIRAGKKDSESEEDFSDRLIKRVVDELDGC